MKKPLLRFTLYTIIVYLTYAATNTAIAASEPSEENEIHFCGVTDNMLTKQFSDQFPDRRYRVSAAHLNVGEPRTVRMIYFLPNDRSFRADAVQRMKTAIPKIQTFYAQQMRAYGYGYSTFRIETDPQGEPVVHRVDGGHPESHYLNDSFSTVVPETEQAFNLDANIYLIVFDNSSGSVGRLSERAGGLGERRGKNGGVAMIPEPFDGNSTHVMAHELGHAFGLRHDFTNPAYIMSYGERSQSQLSACHAEFLAVHPYFNPDVEAQEAPPPTIELISSLTYPAGSETVSVHLKLTDSNGLHQVFLFRRHFFEVWGCRGLTGKNDAIVEFDYDGYSGAAATWANVIGIGDFNTHPITVMAVDMEGNIGWEHFTLSAELTHSRPQTLEIISGDHQQGQTNIQLPYPLVVEVRDQNGNPLPGVQVTFTVIAGGGRLSGRFTLENAMSDANGRVEKPFTPGLGTNIVQATIQPAPGIRQPVATFRAIGIGASAVSVMAGDYQRWHLPDGVTRRLGKGRIGESDRSVAFSLDGQHLAVASSIGVWLYDVATARELALLPSAHRVHSVAFSIDGRMLAAGTESRLSPGGVVLWDIMTHKQIAISPSTNDSVVITSVSFSPNGRILAFRAEVGGKVKLWDVETGNVVTLEERRGPESGGIVLTETEAYKHYPLSVSFSPDGRLLASGSEDGTVKLWDVETETLIAALSGHRLTVTSVSFSPDGRLLASGSIDETVKLWDVLARENIGTLSGHRGQVRSVTFSRDGGLLASGSYDKTVKLWDVETRQNIDTFEHYQGEFYTVTFSLDGRFVASGSTDGSVKLWDVATGNVESEISGHGSVGRSVSFSPVDMSLASGSYDGTVRLWDVATGRNVETFGSHASIVTSVSFSPDGRLLASGSYDQTVKLWDAEAGTNVASRFTAHCGGAVLSVSFSRDATILASGDVQGMLLWNSATGDQISTPLGYASLVRSVSFSPDGAILAFAADFGAKLWDVAAHMPIATLEAASQIYSVSFSPDGTILAAAGINQDPITLWDVSTKEKIGILVGHTGGPIASMSFSPDGTVLASGAADHTVKVWGVATHTLLATLEHAASVNAVSFSRDGTLLASGSEVGGTVLLWDMSELALDSLGQVDETIPDPNLRAAVETALKVESGEPISPSEMAMLDRLEASQAAISNLTGLEFANNLTYLDLEINLISDISAVSGLTNLDELDLTYNSISDISAVSGLANLIHLKLGGNSISDISAVSGLTNLISLDFEANSISDISAVSGLTNLIYLDFIDNSISDISAVSGLTNLISLLLRSNLISDISAVSGLANLISLRLESNSISDISAVSGLTNLDELDLTNNSISDISPLIANTGLGQGDTVDVRRNPLSYASINTHIPTLQSRGVSVEFDNQAHPALLKISGDNQRRMPGEILANPFIVEAQDANGSALAGVAVKFTVTAGGGTLSTQSTITDANGRTQSTLILGPNLGINTVEVSAAGIESPATFYAIADTESPPIIADVNSDGNVNVLDLIVIASELGNKGQNLIADVNSDGTVNILDLILVAGMFDGAAAAPSAQSQVPETLTAVEVQGWLTDARTLEVKDFIMKRGIVVLEQLLVFLTPKETELLANYPNPFNPETWIPYRLAEDAFVTLTIYDGSGRVARTLEVGYRIAAFYEGRSKTIYWDGRNDVGERVASGVYFYTLTAGDYSATRKMVILK